MGRGESTAEDVSAVYTYGHPTVDGGMLDRLVGVKVISNYGVGVDHIDLKAAAERGVPVGNTPGILDGATADMGFTLLLAAGRRLCEGDRYAAVPRSRGMTPVTCWAGKYMGRRWESLVWGGLAGRWRSGRRGLR